MEPPGTEPPGTEPPGTHHDRDGEAARADRFPLAAVYVALVLVGVVLGVWGAFLVPLRLFGNVEGFADLLAFGGNVAAGVLGAWGARSVPAAAMPGVGWLVTVLAVGSIARPRDEVIIPSKLGGDPGVGTVGTLFLLAGALGAVLAIVLANRLRAVQTREAGSSLA